MKSQVDDGGLRQRVLLAFQVALLGMVPAALRGVTVGWEEGHIMGCCIFDGPIGEDIEEICSDIEAEIYAFFPSYEVEIFPRQLDAPLDLNQEVLDAWVFRRME